MKKFLLPLPFLLLAACGQPENPAPAKPTPRPVEEMTGLKNRAIVGNITESKALELLYGKIDPKKKAAAWTAQGITMQGSFLENGASTWVTALQAEKVREGSDEKYYLLTSIVPTGNDPFDCHACAPGLGAAVFVKRGDHWDVEAQTPVATVAGSYGQAPEAKLTAIGPAHHGFLLMTGYMNQGISESATFLLAPQGKDFKEAFAQQTGEENGGNCAEEGDNSGLPACYDYSTSVDFRPGPKADYYDIVTATNGTKPGDNGKVVDATANVTFRFNGQKYVPVK